MRRIVDAAADHRTAVGSGSPQALQRAVKKITRAFKAAAVVQGWPNPAFLPWLVLSRASSRPDLLVQAVGAAVFRWRRDATQTFRTHAWQLDLGVPDLKQRGVFPI